MFSQSTDGYVLWKTEQEFPLSLLWETEYPKEYEQIKTRILTQGSTYDLIGF